jgi:hypothetical protein
MLRTVCLAFVCLLSLSAAFALRPTGSANTAPNLAAAAPRDATGEPDASPAVNSVSKADRLPIAFPDRIRQAKTEANGLVPVQVEVAPEPTKRPITSWHWHVGSNKITRK